MTKSDTQWFRKEARGVFHDFVGIVSFAWSMWKKLRENKHKASWIDNGTLDFFQNRIEEELNELRYQADTDSDRMKECADIGNFAMMIHERSRRAR